MMIACVKYFVFNRLSSSFAACVLLLFFSSVAPAAAADDDDDDDHVAVNRCRCCGRCCSSASLVFTFYAIFARATKECAKIQK